MKVLGYVIALVVTFVGTVGSSALFYAWEMDAASLIALLTGMVALLGICAVWESDR